MAINLELMRKKLAVLKGEVKGGGGGNSPFFRPQEGEQDIRIVPSPDGDPFKEFSSTITFLITREAFYAPSVMMENIAQSVILHPSFGVNTPKPRMKQPRNLLSSFSFAHATSLQ
jgi:hypothetical protein